MLFTKPRVKHGSVFTGRNGYFSSNTCAIGAESSLRSENKREDITIVFARIIVMMEKERSGFRMCLEVDRTRRADRLDVSER